VVGSPEVQQSLGMPYPLGYTVEITTPRASSPAGGSRQCTRVGGIGIRAERLHVSLRGHLCQASQLGDGVEPEQSIAVVQGLAPSTWRFRAGCHGQERRRNWAGGGGELTEKQTPSRQTTVLIYRMGQRGRGPKEKIREMVGTALNVLLRIKE